MWGLTDNKKINLAYDLINLMIFIYLQASKYKNAVPIIPKFEELIRDVSVGSYMSHGNYIAASAAYFAFNWDIHGSNLAVLPINTKGRQIKANVPLLYAHADFVTDFAFSPFDDGLLATGSQDSTVSCLRKCRCHPSYASTILIK